MNRKILLMFASLFILSMMLTPLAVAKPGAEKTNEKFADFQLVCSGSGSEAYEKAWASPPESDTPNVFHGRGGGWVTGDTVELTVGEETFDTDTDPYSVDYATTFDIEVFYNNDGVPTKYNLKLTDIVTVYDEAVEIGTLVLKIKAVVEFTDGAPSGYSGTVQGYGTEALEDVHISAVDLGMTGPQLYTRIGTITGWPEQITNN